jgi:peptidoglycan/LPS O-acetylase OafA/YrhL
MRANLFSTVSAATVLGALPAWTLFWWSQRAWAPPIWIVAGGPAFVLAAMVLGVVALRREEPLGWAAALMALALPVAAVSYLNFAGSP